MRRASPTRRDPPPGPPPPYTIELDCRPLELVATCIEPPTDTATFDVLRSINGGRHVRVDAVGDRDDGRRQPPDAGRAVYVGDSR